MALRGIDPESYIAELTLVYEEHLQMWMFRVLWRGAVGGGPLLENIQLLKKLDALKRHS